MIITLKDGSTKEYGSPMSVLDIAKDISEGLGRMATAGEQDRQNDNSQFFHSHIPKTFLVWRAIRPP